MTVSTILMLKSIAFCFFFIGWNIAQIVGGEFFQMFPRMSCCIVDFVSMITFYKTTAGSNFFEIFSIIREK